MKNNIPYYRFILLAFGIGIGIFIGWLDIGNAKTSESLRLAVMSFSILTGMLIAVMTLVGDPRLLLSGNWRIAYEHKEDLKNVLLRCTLLCFFYLVAILLLFLTSLFITSGEIFARTEIFARIARGFATTIMIWSFGLPIMIYFAQIDRLEREIEQRRKYKP